jgi:YcxB-like protein
MEKLEIELKFNLQNFQDIYYADGQASIFKNHLTKKPLLLTIISVLITVVLYLLSLKFAQISWMLVLAFLFIVPLIIYLLIYIIKFYNWKSTVDNFLKDMGKYNSYHLSLTDNGIELQQDKTTTIDTWNSIQSVRIEEHFILLYNNKGLTYILPVKSMDVAEFEQLKTFIKLKVK